MKDFEEMNPRELWDFIDGIFLRHRMNVKEIAELLGIEEAEYLELRRNKLPLPKGTTDALLKKFALK